MSRECFFRNLEKLFKFVVCSQTIAMCTSCGVVVSCRSIRIIVLYGERLNFYSVQITICYSWDHINNANNDSIHQDGTKSQAQGARINHQSSSWSFMSHLPGNVFFGLLSVSIRMGYVLAMSDWLDANTENIAKKIQKYYFVLFEQGIETPSG